jgi:transcription antitermination factor NusG
MSFWSVVQTQAQREHIAAKFLKQAAFETYLPKIVTMRGAREKVTPLFPGYLFVEIIDDRFWEVRWTTGVIRVLMLDDRPAKVSPMLMNAIRKREGDDGLVRLPKPTTRELQCGDNVRILRGSFEHRFGIYQGQSSVQRSRILLTLLGRQVPVLISTDCVARME